MDNNRRMHSVKTARYMMQTRPVFNRQALFSDETENYLSPMEPEVGQEITVRFRTAAGNVDAVYLVSDLQRHEMQFEKTEGDFDFYCTRIRVGWELFRYYFEIESGRLHCFYCRTGVTDEPDEQYVFAVRPGFHTPDWAKGAVMYQILIDRFRNGDPSNDVLDREYSYIREQVSRVKNWSERPASMDVREFYGGDMAGVMEKLDYLQDLGIEAIYFNPLFVSPSNHKYDTQDYDYIDPHLAHFEVDEGELLAEGDQDNMHASRYICRVTRQENLEAANRMFIEMVEACHRRGIRVILDGVFNHCGSFNKWMDRERIYERQPGYPNGAYVSGTSPYRSFFQFLQEDWPYNPHYDGWWGHDTLPKLNYEESPKLEEYILEIGRKWVSPPYNADGWRLDVAADLGHSPEYNHVFWKKFRHAVKEANPDALILAEHYGDPSAWLGGDEWDTVMNYDAFMEPLTWFFTGMEKHSDRSDDSLWGNAECFSETMRYHMARMLGPSLLTAMNELSNHDHSRFLTRTNRKTGRMDHYDYDAASDGVNPAVMREAVVMQMTWPGAPTVYYGDEAGLCGFTDPDNRRTYPWGHENTALLAFHRDAIAMHKRYGVFRKGSFLFLYKDTQVLSYARFCDSEQALVVINNDCESREAVIPAWRAQVTDGPLTCVLRSDDAIYKDDRAQAADENPQPGGEPEHSPQQPGEEAEHVPQQPGEAARDVYEVVNGELQITIPPYAALVFIRNHKGV